MRAMIEGLLAKGHAYQADGTVYFEVRPTFPAYGAPGREPDRRR